MRTWRALQSMVPPEGLQCSYLPFVRQLAAAVPGTDSFARSALCLEVFCERGLLACRRQEDDVYLLLTDHGKKVSLDDSPYLQTLYHILDTSKRGGTR